MQGRDSLEYTDEEIEALWKASLEERKRLKPRWEMHRSDDPEFIKEVAKTLGWLDSPQKVQVRYSPEARLNGTKKDFWVIEPYEEDCNCPNIVPPPTPNEV